MLRRNRWFIAAALVWGLLGAALALAGVIAPGVIPGDLLRAHLHLMMLGFVGQMIFGVGLHVLPRFSGHLLFSERVADLQFVLVNLGLPAMLAGWLGAGPRWVQAGGIAVWLALACFALNIAFTVRARGP